MPSLHPMEIVVYAIAVVVLIVGLRLLIVGW